GLSLSLAPPAGADTTSSPVYPNGPVYGLAGIASSQSFRLAISNDASAATARCRVDVSLVDDASTAFATASTVVEPGQTEQLAAADFTYAGDFNCGNDGPDSGFCPPAGAAGIAAATAARLQFRPVIALVSANPGISTGQACGRTQAALELIDAATGQTEVFWPPQPVHPRNPLLATLWALYPPVPVVETIGTTPDDELRVNLVNTNQNPASAGCPVRIGVQDTGGAVLQEQRINLAPGESVSVVQAGGAAGGGVLSLRPIAAYPTGLISGIPCRGVLRTVELVDALSQRTRLFWPPTPHPSPHQPGILNS
ncbi:MAG: hypothetical protein ACXWTY_18565, partial [Methylobacter sp.]